MITFKEKDQIWQHETTIYWFDVDGVMFGLSDRNGSQKLLDSEGYTIDACDDNSNTLDKLSTALTDDIVNS